MKKSESIAQTSSDIVYKKLRARIFAKKYRPGERLPEVALAKDLEVSRTPVREALRRLATEGLVLLIPNVGARLACPSQQEIINTYEVREYLECMAARKAASHISAEQVAELEQAIEDEERVFAARNFEEYLEVNRRFHCTLAGASGNPVLAEYVGNLMARTCVYMIFYENFFDAQSNPSLDEHRALLKALVNREPQKAEQLMKIHLMLSATSLKSNEGMGVRQESTAQ